MWSCRGPLRLEQWAWWVARVRGWKFFSWNCMYKVCIQRGHVILFSVCRFQRPPTHVINRHFIYFNNIGIVIVNSALLSSVLHNIGFP